MEAVGNGSEGDRKDVSNGAGPGSDVQGSGLVGAIIWKQELCGDWGYARGPGGVPSLGGTIDHGDDDKTRGS